jgi:hypothetical protein
MLKTFAIPLGWYPFCVSEYKTQEAEIYSDPYPVAHNGGDHLLSINLGNRQVAKVIGARSDQSDRLMRAKSGRHSPYFGDTPCRTAVQSQVKTRQERR